MTEQVPTINVVGSPVDPAIWKDRQVPADFPIKVDEDAETVTVAAGVTQRTLLDCECMSQALSDTVIAAKAQTLCLSSS